MLMQGEIVPASPWDGPSIHHMTAAAGVFTPEEVKTENEIWTDYLSNGPDGSGYYYLVYRENGVLVGYACYGPHPLTHGTYDLYWLVTHPEHRGRGIGKALLRQVEEEVRRLGGRLLVIETSGKQDYDPTRRFYLNVGCQLAANIRDFYGPGDDLSVFVRYL